LFLSTTFAVMYFNDINSLRTYLFKSVILWLSWHFG
jgi:hypothetical protein